MTNPVKAFVVDTNVGIVANGRFPQASYNDVGKCIDALLDATRNHIAIDDSGRIFDEYFSHLSRSGQPGVGDTFAKWVWDNQGNSQRCEQVRITPCESDKEDYEEFPRDRDLIGFDPSDRKFVAVALGSKSNPTILNATDSDWLEHEPTLRRHGVRIDNICPSLLRRR